VPTGAIVAVTVIAPADVWVDVPVAVKRTSNVSVFVRSSPVNVNVVWLLVGLELLTAVKVVFVKVPAIADLLGITRLGAKVIPAGIPLTVNRILVPLRTAVPSVEESTLVLKQVAHPSVIVMDAVDAAVVPLVKNKSDPPLVPPVTNPLAMPPMPAGRVVTTGNVFGDGVI